MLVLLFVLAGVTALSILNGWVLSVLWGWFLVPLGVHPIGIANAIGFALIVGLLVQRHTLPSGKTDEGHKVANLVLAVIVPFIALGLGWVIHQFQ